MTVPLKDFLDKVRGVKQKTPEQLQPPSVEQKQEETTVDKKLRESWDKREGEWSEVVDSEGHRIHINHY